MLLIKRQFPKHLIYISFYFIYTYLHEGNTFNIYIMLLISISDRSMSATKYSLYCFSLNFLSWISIAFAIQKSKGTKERRRREIKRILLVALSIIFEKQRRKSNVFTCRALLEMWSIQDSSSEAITKTFHHHIMVSVHSIYRSETRIICELCYDHFMI